MTKGTFKISGVNSQCDLVNALNEFQQDNYVVTYEFENGKIYMFEQYKRSLNNHVLNVILDFTFKSSKNEFIIQCFAMGAKNRAQLSVINYEKGSIEDFRSYLGLYSMNKNLEWSIDEQELG